MSHESTFLSCTLKFLEKHIHVGTTASDKIILVTDILYKFPDRKVRRHSKIGQFK